jgi:8-oxo-dGTP pyrophosphatase MutT (NUDIX family)
MTNVLTPRPAATVLALRDGPLGYQVLMLRRNLNSDFVGGAYVFPGGGVDASDSDAIIQRLTFGAGEQETSKRLGVTAGGLAYYVASLRELFEEAGLLIACRANGELVDLSDAQTVQRLAALRRQLNAGDLGFAEVLASEDLVLDLRGLAYLAHWVTPVGPPRRYDTRFFVALAPSDQTAAHDAGETIEDQWLRPVDALLAFQRGDFDMVFPTVRTLQTIANLENAHDVLDYANALDSVEAIEPRIVMRADQPRIVLPGEDGYDD